MEFSSADFCKLTLQEVADFLLDQEKHCALCNGFVEGKLYTLKVELNMVGDENAKID